MINLKGLPLPRPFPPSSHSWLRVEQVWRTNPLKIPCGHVPKPNQFFFSFSNLSPRSPLLLLSASSCCWRNIFGFMWIRVIYSNRFRFRFRFRFAVAPPLAAFKAYCGKVAFEGVTMPTPFPSLCPLGWPGYNSESIVMVLAACKFFFIISY